jgi:Mn-dependent DtxR family transcriptional regulator
MSYLVIDHLWKGRRKMEKKILDAMKKAGKPVRPGDVAKMIGADGKEVSKVIKELKKQGKVISPKNCFYEPA